jgi:prepilin-type N-terminal cleavage/methylation domain-containing protein
LSKINIIVKILFFSLTTFITDRKGFMSFKNESGFTLPEVLMAMAIMSVVALGYMHLTQQRAKDERTKRVNEEITIFLADVRGLLSTRDSCKSTFAQTRILNTNPISIPAIKNSVGVEIYSNSHFHREGLFEISALTLEDIKSSGAIGSETIATLNITFERKGAILATPQITRGMELFFQLDDNGSIIDCSLLAQMGQTKAPPSLSIGDGATEKLIQEATRDNPELQYAQELLRNMQENQKRLLEAQERLRELDSY